MIRKKLAHMHTHAQQNVHHTLNKGFDNDQMKQTFFCFPTISNADWNWKPTKIYSKILIQIGHTMFVHQMSIPILTINP